MHTGAPQAHTTIKRKVKDTPVHAMPAAFSLPNAYLDDDLPSCAPPKVQKLRRCSAGDTSFDVFELPPAILDGGRTQSVDFPLFDMTNALALSEAMGREQSCSLSE